MQRLLFSSTLFLSAFLLFLIQPLVGRLLLPVLGGSASVWTTCLVFFQTALLAGYLWSHLTTRMRSPTGRVLHIVTAFAGYAALPLGLGGLLAAPVDANPTGWLLKSMLVAIGLPFFALASNAPSLQQWFSRTGDIHRGDPYFLYSASNVGSLLGLLAYPLVVEPWLPLTAQRHLWSAGYAAIPWMLIACAWASRGAALRGDVRVEPAEPWRGGLEQRLRWVGLPFVTSSLTAGVTAYVSTELAPIPLLWVLPLGLYLLTFVQAFAGKGADLNDRRVRLAALVAFPLAAWHVTQTAPTWVLVALHLGAVYVISWLCHSRLYAERPRSSHLTAFYLWIAVGGALGGAFNAIVAPLVFDTAAEYPLGLILAAFFLRPTMAVTRRVDVLAPRLVAVASLLWLSVTSVPNPSLALLLPAGQIARHAFRQPRVRGVAAFVMAMLFVRFTIDAIADNAYVTRSFFAAHRVVDNYRPGYRALIHGATLHGMQATGAGDHRAPVTYFAREGPIGQVFAAHGARLQHAAIGVVGLGAGELAGYAGAGQGWTFFEIDPAVETIARERFTFLSGAPVPIDVTLGDGRVSIARASSRFDLLIMDAFSSDAIPRHLLTVEAFRLYLDRLAPGGLVALHISNRFVDLEPILARAAATLGLVGLFQFDSPDDTSPGAATRLASSWVVLARTADDLLPLGTGSRWRRLEADRSAAWTDEQADILTAIRWRSMWSAGRR